MTDLFKSHGIVYQGICSLSPRETNKLLGRGAILLDIREVDYTDYKAFDAENVLNLPKEKFEIQLNQLNPDKHYIVSDSSGIHTRDYAEKMISAGFQHVACLSGGFVEWERDGFPVREDINERLSGSCACQLKPRERK